MPAPRTPDPVGTVPPDNQPGHHPEVEQDKPQGPPPRPARATALRWGFSFHPLFRVPALLAGVTELSAYVRVDEDELVVRFGPWRMAVDRADIESATLTGPYQPWKVIGPPHLSLADQGITFGTNPTAGVCIRLRRPAPGLEPTGRLRHPALTVTVADAEGLADLLSA